MLAHATVAHVLPGGGDLAARLRQARIPFRRALENVSMARTGLEAHEAAEESPAHRGNLLAPGLTRVGLGLAHGARPGGGAVTYLAEILVEPGGPGPGGARLRTPEELVREALWDARARLGLPPLTADPRLDELAREGAAALARDGALAPEQLASRAAALGRGLTAADAWVASGPADAAASRHLADGRLRRVGVAVALGGSARWGPGRYHVAVVWSDEPTARP